MRSTKRLTIVYAAGIVGCLMQLHCMGNLNILGFATNQGGSAAATGGTGTAGGATTGGAAGAATTAGAPVVNYPPFKANSVPAVTRKLSMLLASASPTAVDVQTAVADPCSLGQLVDGWMASPAFDQRMIDFFNRAFQQQPGGDFQDFYARTVLQITKEGRPFTDAFTTHQFYMPTSVAQAYVYNEIAYAADDNAQAEGLFQQENPHFNFRVTSLPIPYSQSVDPQSSNYLLFTEQALASRLGGSQGCYNGIGTNDPGRTYNFVHSGYVNIVQCVFNGDHAMALPTDTTDYRWINLRPEKPGEQVTKFWDIAKLRGLNELVLRTTRVGFFSTPSFFQLWPSNNGNQHRVTADQAMIVGLNEAIDTTNHTVPTELLSLDPAHAAPGSVCFSCHSTLDPMRAVFIKNFSYTGFYQNNPAQQMVGAYFGFHGEEAPLSTLDDLAQAIITHPDFPAAWVQKVCYWANGQACDQTDPEFVQLTSQFVASNYNFRQMVRNLVLSNMVTGLAQSKTTGPLGSAPTRLTSSSAWCTSMSARLGITSACDAALRPMMPDDTTARGTAVPTIITNPSLFSVSGIEGMCHNMATQAVRSSQNAVLFMGQQATTDSLVTTVMQVAPTDPAHATLVTILNDHVAAAKTSGASDTEAFESAFMLACVSPINISMGL